MQADAEHINANASLESLPPQQSPGNREGYFRSEQDKSLRKVQSTDDQAAGCDCR
jgi:hypothetical protein